VLIVETLRLDHHPQKALEEAEVALQKYPYDRPLRMLRASLLGEQGRVDEGIRQLQSLLNNTPADREVHLAVAQVYSQAKRYAEAEATVRKVLALSPNAEDQEYALFVLGSIFERQKKYELAEEQFKKVLAVNPLNAPAANYLGYMLADRGVRLEESVGYIKKALELEPNNGAYLDSLGWAYFKMNRLDLAEPNLEKAARLVADDPTVHEHLGHLYLQMGKEALAREHWERALEVWPQAVSGDFDADQAAKLRKQLDQLKRDRAKAKSARR
jgi:tetratricopeptide (TPR) repeat protein